jgi:hypothetical protein
VPMWNRLLIRSDEISPRSTYKFFRFRPDPDSALHVIVGRDQAVNATSGATLTSFREPFRGVDQICACAGICTLLQTKVSARMPWSSLKRRPK